jgi:hypothetical protein
MVVRGGDAIPARSRGAKLRFDCPARAWPAQPGGPAELRAHAWIAESMPMLSSGMLRSYEVPTDLRRNPRHRRSLSRQIQSANRRTTSQPLETSIV